MIAILGFVLGGLGIAAVAVAVGFVATRCGGNGEGPRDVDGGRDVGRDRDGGGDIVDAGDGPDIIPDADGPPDGGDFPPDIGDCCFDGPDVFWDGGDGGDGGDVEPPPRGINRTAAFFSGRIADIDDVNGDLVAFGGPGILRCDVSGIEDSTCNTIADLPRDIFNPINYHSLQNGYGVAVASPSFGTPFDMMFVNENAANPSAAVERRLGIAGVTMPGVGDLFVPTFPRGLAKYRATSPAPSHDRIFLSTGNWLSDESRFIRGTILCFALNGVPNVLLEHIGFPEGINTSALAMTRLDLGGGEKDILLALNAGAIDPADEHMAGIAVIDPELAEIGLLKTISLGEVAASPLAEFAMSANGRKVYVGIDEPSREVMEVDLVSNGVRSIGLDGLGEGEAAGIKADSSRIYFASANHDTRDGNIVFIDASSRRVLGKLPLSEEPTALEVAGGYLYIAAGNTLIAVDPSEVELVR